MLDLVDVMLDTGELNDSVIKLQSVEQLINEHKLNENIKVMNKFTDIRRKICEIKNESEKLSKISQE